MALKKKFIDVEVPLLDDVVSVLGTPETLAGKTIKLDLSRKLRGKSLEVILKIYNQNGLYALPKNLNLLKFYIRRMIRKRASYVEDSFKAKCKDVEVTIKPFLITRKRVSRAVRNNLRKTSKDFLINYLKEKEYLDVAKEIVIGQLQKEMLPKLKKVYPLSFCEIRVFETKEIDTIKYVFTPLDKKPREAIKVQEEVAEEKTQAEELEEAAEKKKKEKSENKEETQEEKVPAKEKKSKKKTEAKEE